MVAAFLHRDVAAGVCDDEHRLHTDAFERLVDIGLERHHLAAAQPLVGADQIGSTSELQSLMRISYAVFCLKKNTYEQNLINKLTLNKLITYVQSDTTLIL